MTRFTKELRKKFVEIYPTKICNISATCTAVGIGRKAFYKAMKDNKKFKQAIEDAREGLIDTAEMMAYKQVVEGDGQMIRYILSRKGAGRGYIDKQQIQVEQEVPLFPNIVHKDHTKTEEEEKKE